MVSAVIVLQCTVKSIIIQDPDKNIIAKLTLNPGFQAAVVVGEHSKAFGKQDLGEIRCLLAGAIKEVKTGDMTQCEAMLISQAGALQSIFVSLS